MFHEAVDVLVIEVTFRGVVMVGAIKVAKTITTTTLKTVTIMLTRIIILKEAIEVVVVLGVVTVYFCKCIYIYLDPVTYAYVNYTCLISHFGLSHQNNYSQRGNRGGGGSWRGHRVFL